MGPGQQQRGCAPAVKQASWLRPSSGKTGLLCLPDLSGCPASCSARCSTPAQPCSLARPASRHAHIPSPLLRVTAPRAPARPTRPVCHRREDWPRRRAALRRRCGAGATVAAQQGATGALARHPRQLGSQVDPGEPQAAGRRRPTAGQASAQRELGALEGPCRRQAPAGGEEPGGCWGAGAASAGGLGWRACPAWRSAFMPGAPPAGLTPCRCSRGSRPRRCSGCRPGTRQRSRLRCGCAPRCRWCCPAGRRP